MPNSSIGAAAKTVQDRDVTNQAVHDSSRWQRTPCFLKAVISLLKRTHRVSAEAVDKGVHSFVLDTPRYWDFCTQHAGTYLHHVPHLPEERESQPKVLYDTIWAIRTAGFPLDTELWGAQEVDCHQCHACCSDSPRK